MKRKGFTLVELIAVIAILAIILLISMPNLIGSIKSNKEDASNVVENMVISAGRSYVLDHGLSHPTLVPIENLCGEYITCPIIDANGDEVSGYISVDNNNVYRIANSTITRLVVNLNGGTTSQVFSDNYNIWEKVTLVEPTKTGFNFDSWRVIRGTGKVENNVVTVGDSETEIYALWVGWPTLTVNLDGGNTIQTFESTYSTGRTIQLVVPTKPGFVFTGWQLVSGDSILSGNSITFGATDTTIKALWGACGAGTYLSGNSCIPCATGTYSQGSANGSCTPCVAGTIPTNDNTGCIACPNGQTNVGGETTCANCSNATGASSWETPSWDSNNNTVSNSCKVSTCAAGYYLNGTICSMCTGANTTTEENTSTSCTTPCSNSTGVATWSNSATCTAATCNAGYKISGKNCVACNVNHATAYSSGCTPSACETNYVVSGSSCISKAWTITTKKCTLAYKSINASCVGTDHSTCVCSKGTLAPTARKCYFYEYEIVTTTTTGTSCTPQTQFSSCQSNASVDKINITCS